MKIQQDVAEWKIFIFSYITHYGAMQNHKSVKQLSPANLSPPLVHKMQPVTSSKLRILHPPQP